MKKIVAAVIAALATSSAFCLEVPKPCPGGDARIRCAVYNPNEVIGVTAVYGLHSFILFAPGEEVLDLGGGDTDGWNIGVIKAKNGLFIKPKTMKPVSNITIVTNKRYYNFDFDVAPVKQAEKRIYMVRYIYPEDEAKLKQKPAGETEKNLITEKLKFAAANKQKNEDYWAEGTKAIIPVLAFDDGEFTYFRFAPNTPFPAVYIVTPDGEESMVTKNVPEPNTIKVHSISKRFVLRSGEMTAFIYNESYDSYGVERATSTVSNEVERTVNTPEAMQKAELKKSANASPAPAASSMERQPPELQGLPTADISSASTVKRIPIGSGARDVQ